MGLAIVSLIVLAILGAIAGLILSRIFATAAARNENRPGGEEEREQGPGDEQQKQARARELALFFGGAFSALGVLLGVVGMISAASEFLIELSIPAISLAMVLAAVGYALGARRLGAAAAVVSAAALILGLAASQGYVPGVQQTDNNLPAYEPQAE